MDAKKRKSMILKAIPDDVYDEIWRVQCEEKKRIKRQFSLELAVYKIIKDAIKKETK